MFFPKSHRGWLIVDQKPLRGPKRSNWQDMSERDWDAQSRPRIWLPTRDQPIYLRKIANLQLADNYSNLQYHGITSSVSTKILFLSSKKDTFLSKRGTDNLQHPAGLFPFGWSNKLGLVLVQQASLTAASVLCKFSGWTSRKKNLQAQ